MNGKVSVIMASFLGTYKFCATNRVIKFHRAIKSFINQTYKNAELIIVSDGCEKTNSEFLKYNKNSNIKLLISDKQPTFSGNIRNIGLSVAAGDIICYLDTDDFLGENHLQKIADTFKNYHNIDWISFDDYIVYYSNLPHIPKVKRKVLLSQGSIGTSSVAHRKISEINWLGCNGYNHDWTFIKKIIDSERPHKKMEDGGEYYVCHIPNSVDS